MGFEQKDNAGALFKNKDKTPDNTYADYRGPCMVNGKEMEVSAWLKTSKSGDKLSLSFKPPYKPKKYAGDDDAGRRDDDAPW